MRKREWERKDGERIKFMGEQSSNRKGEKSYRQVRDTKMVMGDGLKEKGKTYW